MLKIQGTASLILNTNYNLTDVPVPALLGPLMGGKVTLTQ